MDEKAIQIVNQYVLQHYKKLNLDFEIYIVWKCKTLQNWKYLISTSLFDGLYFELTYNGDIKEWYLDVYNKIQNIIIPNLS